MHAARRVVALEFDCTNEIRLLIEQHVEQEDDQRNGAESSRWMRLPTKYGDGHRCLVSRREREAR